MKRLFLLIALCLTASCAQAGERILALAPHACEILFAVGAGKDIVGVGEYCDYPPAARRLPVVGNHQRIYVEAALRLKPTLVVTMQANLAGMSVLRRGGVRVCASNPHNMAELMQEFRRLGRLSGHEEAGERLAASFAAGVKALQDQRRRRVRVFYEVWTRPLMTVGGDSFLTDALATVGADNVFAAMPGESLRVNLEAVLRQKPEIILLPDVAAVNARRTFWRRWLGDGVRVLTVPADLLNRPGPRLLDGLSKLSRQLQGGT